ncbi:MAG: hypothetical protein HUU29_10835, partial [Planctomycetaceae bacterium]|nr:hypothetical protein [Planctomycetaceae bacterium]
ELHQRTSFDKVVYIGDGPWDVKACKRLNLPFLGVRDDGLHDSLKSRGAHNVITNYADHSHALEMLESATPPM